MTRDQITACTAAGESKRLILSARRLNGAKRHAHSAPCLSSEPRMKDAERFIQETL